MRPGCRSLLRRGIQPSKPIISFISIHHGPRSSTKSVQARESPINRPSINTNREKGIVYKMVINHFFAIGVSSYRVCLYYIVYRVYPFGFFL